MCTGLLLFLHTVYAYQVIQAVESSAAKAFLCFRHLFHEDRL